MKSVLSLFSGVGGLCCKGIELAGFQQAFDVCQFVEISPYSQKVLEQEHPNTPIHADIKTYEPERPFDIVCGGFPCHGTSQAGDRLGLNDERSGLWREMLRVIMVANPSFVLIENPAGLRFSGLVNVLRELNEIGYICEWESITAEEVGLPHRRQRLFIIAYPYGLFLEAEPSPWTNQIRYDVETIRQSYPQRDYIMGLRAVDDGILVGVGKNTPGNFEARRAYGLSCSPRQSAVAWKRIKYLVDLEVSASNELWDVETHSSGAANCG